MSKQLEPDTVLLPHPTNAKTPTTFRSRITLALATVVAVWMPSPSAAAWKVGVHVLAARNSTVGSLCRSLDRMAIVLFSPEKKNALKR
jgi:hypothetical protein